ncbi:Major facilitator superfamily [Trinorchestia longiramus]|nr:Major facilitator superfamily [Trinorchestia longiramus]
MSEEDERVSPPSNGGKEETQSFIPPTAPPISTTTTTIATTPTSSCKDGNSSARRLSQCSAVAVPMLSIPPQQEPPDGGLQAWLVMMASFFCNGVLFGTINSSGVIFAELRKDLEEQGVENPASKASLCLSLTIGMTFLMSLVSGVLTDKLGVRTTTFIGGALATGGLFISSLVYHRIEFLTLSFGFLLGLGGSLAYTPSLVILGHYFRRRLGIVNGFVTAGSSLFTIFMPMMFEVILASYDLKVLFQVLTAFMALLMVCAFIFKPRLAVLPRDSQYAAHDEVHRPRNFKSKCKQVVGQIINFEIWRNKRFVIWALCIPIALFGYFVPYVHLVSGLCSPGEWRTFTCLFSTLHSFKCPTLTAYPVEELPLTLSPQLTSGLGAHQPSSQPTHPPVHKPTHHALHHLYTQPVHQQAHYTVHQPAYQLEHQPFNDRAAAGKARMRHWP